MNTYRLITMALLFLAFTACKNESKPESDAVQEIASVEDDNHIRITKKQFEKSGYVIGKSEKVNFEKIIPVTGSIDIPEKNRAKASTYIAGTIGKINLIEGQWVNKGQNLFTITNPELISIQENYLLATEELNYKNAEQVRLEQLLNEKLTTKNELTKVNFEINNLKTKIAALKTRLQLVGMDVNNLSNDNLGSTISILAPMGGYVSNIHAMEGMYLESAQSAMEITNTGHKHLELKVLEKDINKISIGQKIAFYLQDDPMTKYQAEVYLINKMVDDDHMVKVHCHIEKEDSKSLLSGMYITAHIVTQSSKLAALPKEAIVELDGRSYALRLKSSSNEAYVFEKVELRTGSNNEGFIELKDPGLVTEEFLIKGAYFLIM